MKPADLLAFPVSSQEFSTAKLTARQRIAIAALVGGATLTRAAAKAGVTRRTLFSWTQKPAFAAEVARARDGAFRESLDELRRVTGKAVGVAEKLLGAKSTPRVQLGAARTVLGLALKLHEAVGVEERLRRVEDRVFEAKGDAT